MGGDQNHDQGYDNMTNGGAWTWVRPETLIKTQCAPQFNSVLDFIFVNAAAQSWSGTSEILVAPNDCNPSPLTSDHRPVIGRFNMAGDGGPRFTKEQILRKIEEIERQLIQLKEAFTLAERACEPIRQYFSLNLLGFIRFEFSAGSGLQQVQRSLRVSPTALDA